MSLRGLARIALACGLACLLSACWMSEKPLIAGKAAEMVPFAGSYRGEGEDAPQTMTIAAIGDGTYELTDGKPEDRVPVAFVALGGDWYLMQGEGHSDEEGTPPFYLYQLVKRVGADLYFYSPSCDEVPGKFKGLKREQEQIETCNFSRLDGVKAMAMAWIGRLGRHEVADDPEIVRRTAP